MPFVFCPLILAAQIVGYFDQRTGAPHAVGWSKSFVFEVLRPKFYHPNWAAQCYYLIIVKNCNNVPSNGKNVITNRLVCLNKDSQTNLFIKIYKPEEALFMMGNICNNKDYKLTIQSIFICIGCPHLPS